MPPHPSSSASGPAAAPRPTKYHTAAVQDQLLLAPNGPIPPPNKLGRAEGKGLRFQKMSGVKKKGGGGGAGGGTEGGEAGEDGGAAVAGPSVSGAATVGGGEEAGTLPTMESVLESGGVGGIGGETREASEEVGLGAIGEEEEDEDDEDSEDGEGKKKTRRGNAAGSKGRKRISISYIEDKTKRSVTFTKRKSGLMKKAYELSTLTNTNVAVVIVSESGNIFTFCTPSLSGVTDHPKGREVIAQSLAGELRADVPEGKGPKGGKVTKAKGKKVAAGGGTSGAGGSDQSTPALAPPSNIPGPSSYSHQSHSHLSMSPAIDPSLSTPPLPLTSTAHSHHFPMYELPLPPPLSGPPTGPYGGNHGADHLPIPPSVFGSAQHQHLPHTLPPYAHQPQHFPHLQSHSHSHSPSPSPHDFLPRPPSHHASHSPSLPTPPHLSAPTGPPSAPAAPLASLYPSHAVPSPLLPPPASFEEAMREHHEAYRAYQAHAAAVEGGGGGAGWGNRAAGQGERTVLPPIAITEENRGLKRKASDDVEGQAGAVKAAEWQVMAGQVEKEEREERIRAWKRRAEEAVEGARKLRTLPASFFAHSFSLLSSSPSPPALPSSPLSRAYSIFGDDADEPTQMYGSFERMCVKAGLCEEGAGTVEEVVEGAMEEFLGRWLPRELSSLPLPFRSAALASARSHLVSFLDFLEAHEIVSSELHQRATMPSKRTGGSAGETGLGEERRERLYGRDDGEPLSEASEGQLAQAETTVEAKEVQPDGVPAAAEGEEEQQQEREQESAPTEEVVGERRSKRRRK
ncbi:hypothetical protein JCM11251_002717 [Rhodosporidiobolus azoricus]